MDSGYLTMILVLVVIVIMDRVSAVSVTKDITEDDDCKQVMIREKARCEYGVCHTIHIKDCTITMKEVLTPVKVKKCVAKGGGEGGQCVGGVRKKCGIR